jgi:hypothetical protein
VLLIAWLVKLQAQPTFATSVADVLHRAHVGPIPGFVVVPGVLMLYMGLGLIYFLSVASPPPMGELSARRRIRRLPLWQRLVRPYAVMNPRSHLRRSEPS